MEQKTKTYVDQAATSYPKPETVYTAVDKFAREVGIGGGRGNYAENRTVADLFAATRQLCGQLINAAPEQIIFTSGTTESLNTILHGLLEAGDHVVTTPFAHNSVLRPLRYLADRRDLELTLLDVDLETGLDPETLRAALTPRTRLCVLNHISNSFGTVQPVAAVGEILRETEAFFLLDAAQSFGTQPLDVQAWNVDALCFSGHKGPHGPTGTGGFYIHPRLTEHVDPLKMGGTGQNSGTVKYSDSLPKKYEVGTHNSWGIAGLKAGLEHVVDRGVDEIETHVGNLTELAVEELSELEKIELYLPDARNHHGVISLTTNFLSPQDSAALLDKLFDLKLRAGLHCSPEAHRLAGTYPDGTLRASFGLMNNEADVRQLATGLEQLASEVD